MADGVNRGLFHIRQSGTGHVLHVNTSGRAGNGDRAICSQYPLTASLVNIANRILPVFSKAFDPEGRFAVSDSTGANTVRVTDDSNSV